MHQVPGSEHFGASPTKSQPSLFGLGADHKAFDAAPNPYGPRGGEANVSSPARGELDVGNRFGSAPKVDDIPISPWSPRRAGPALDLDVHCKAEGLDGCASEFRQPNVAPNQGQQTCSQTLAAGWDSRDRAGGGHSDWRGPDVSASRAGNGPSNWRGADVSGGRAGLTDPMQAPTWYTSPRTQQDSGGPETGSVHVRAEYRYENPFLDSTRSNVTSMQGPDGGFSSPDRQQAREPWRPAVKGQGKDAGQEGYWLLSELGHGNVEGSRPAEDGMMPAQPSFSKTARIIQNMPPRKMNDDQPAAGPLPPSPLYQKLSEQLRSPQASRQQTKFGLTAEIDTGYDAQQQPGYDLKQQPGYNANKPPGYIGNKQPGNDPKQQLQQGQPDRYELGTELGGGQKGPGMPGGNMGAFGLVAEERVASRQPDQPYGLLADLDNVGAASTGCPHPVLILPAVEERGNLIVKNRGHMRAKLAACLGWQKDRPYREWRNFTTRQQQRYVPIPVSRNRRVLSETKGYRLRLRSLQDLPLPTTQLTGSSLELQMSVTLFDESMGSFYGSTCRSLPDNFDRRLVAHKMVTDLHFSFDVYFHTRVSDPRCIAVVEVIAAERNATTGVTEAEYSLGFALIPLFGQREAGAHSAKLLMGTPRLLLLGSVYGEHMPAPMTLGSCYVVFEAVVFPEMDPYIPLLPENFLVTYNDVIPGLRRFDVQGNHTVGRKVIISTLAAPVLSPSFSLVLNNLSIVIPAALHERLSALPFPGSQAVEEEVVVEAARYCIRVSVHNGRCFVGPRLVLDRTTVQTVQNWQLLLLNGSLPVLDWVPGDDLVMIVVELLVLPALAEQENDPMCGARCVGWVPILPFRSLARDGSTATPAVGAMSMQLELQPELQLCSVPFINWRYLLRDNVRRNIPPPRLDFNLQVTGGCPIPPPKATTMPQMSSTGATLTRSLSPRVPQPLVIHEVVPVHSIIDNPAAASSHHSCPASPVRCSTTAAPQPMQVPNSPTYSAKHLATSQQLPMPAPQLQALASTMQRQLEMLTHAVEELRTERQSLRKSISTLATANKGKHNMEDAGPMVDRSFSTNWGYTTNVAGVPQPVDPSYLEALKQLGPTPLQESKLFSGGPTAGLAQDKQGTQQPSRALLARLHDAGALDALPADVRELLQRRQPQRPLAVPLSLEAEACDDRLAADIVIQLLAFKANKGTAAAAMDLNSLYLTFVFYNFLPTTTELAYLVPTADQNNEVMLLMPSTPNVRGAGTVVKYQLDPTTDGGATAFESHQNAIAKALHFANYLGCKSLHMDLWDGTSLLQVGTTNVQLSGLLRQGREYAEILTEVPVYPVAYHDDTAAVVDVNIERSGTRRKAAPQVCGTLLLRIANIGRRVKNDWFKPGTTGAELQGAGQKKAKIRVKPVPQSPCSPLAPYLSGRLDSPRSALSPHSTLQPRPASPLHTHISNSTAHSPHATSHGPHSQNAHNTANTPHLHSPCSNLDDHLSPSHSPHSTLRGLQSTLYGHHSTSRSEKSPARNPQSTGCSPHSTGHMPHSLSSPLHTDAYSSMWDTGSPLGGASLSSTFIMRKVKRYHKIQQYLSDGPREPSDTWPLQHTDLGRSLQQQLLADIEAARQRHKKDSIKWHLMKQMVQRKVVQIAYGDVVIYEHEFKNPFDKDSTFELHISDPSRLVAINRLAEYQALKQAGVVSYGQDKGEGKMQVLEDNMLAGHKLFLAARESVMVPFKLQALEPPSQQDHMLTKTAAGLHSTGVHKGQAEGIPPADAICIEVVAADSQRLVAMVELTLAAKPAVIDRTFRFYHSEKDMLKQTINLSSLPGMQQLVAGSGRLADLTAACSSGDVLVGLQSSRGNNEKDQVLIKCKCGTAPELHHFYVLLYTNTIMARPIQTWQIFVHALKKVDMAAVLGQSSSTNVVLEGGPINRRLCAYSSHPDELAVSPKSFVLAAESVMELQLVLRPMRTGRHNVKINVVDTDNRELVDSIIVWADAQIPMVSRTFEIHMPYGTTVNKKISYTNPYNQPKTFYLNTNQPWLLNISPQRLEVPAASTRPIGLTFNPGSTPPMYLDVLLFVNDEDDKNEDCFKITVNLSK